jgi:hypothetical protein
VRKRVLSDSICMMGHEWRIIFSFVQVLHEQFDNFWFVLRQINLAGIGVLHQISIQANGGHSCAIYIGGSKPYCTSEKVRTRADHDLVDIVRVGTAGDNEIGVFAFDEETIQPD